MAVRVIHATASTAPPVAGSQIDSDNWNEDHTVTGLAAIAGSGSANDLIAGTVPAAQMPALTGDVTSVTGAVATTIANGAVSLPKMANMATASVIYRKTAGAGAPEVNTLATLKTDLGLTGVNSGDQTITLTGDATGSGTGSFAVTVVKINGTALSGLATGILKNTTTTGVPSIAVAGDFPTLNQNTSGSAATLTTGRTIGMTGDVVWTSASFNGSGNVTGTSAIQSGVVTLAMQANMATASVVYRKTAGAGAPEVQTLATLKTDLGLTGTNSGDQTITLTGDVTGSGTGSFVTAIGANKVTRGMLAATAGATILGATAAGNVADLTAAQAKTFLAITTGDVTGLHPGYIAGNWYSCLDRQVVAGIALTLNNIWLLPFIVLKTITVQALAARVTTLSAAGNFQLAIYANNAATGRPTGTSLVHTGNISTGSTGPVSAAVTSNAALSPGTYWMAINQDNSTAVYQTVNSAEVLSGFLIGSATLANVTNGATTVALSLGVSQTFGTWPDLTSASFTETVTSGRSALVFMQAV